MLGTSTISIVVPITLVDALDTYHTTNLITTLLTIPNLYLKIRQNSAKMLLKEATAPGIIENKHFMIGLSLTFIVALFSFWQLNCQS